MNAKKYGTVKDGVEFSGICESNFRKIVNSDDCTFASRIGRRVIINLEALDLWLEEKAKSKQ